MGSKDSAKSEFANMAREMRAAAGGDFVVGARVEAQIEGWSQHYKGIIVKANPDGSFAIDFDDGESVEKVATTQMNIIQCQCLVEPGQRVQVKLAGYDQILEGTVLSLTGPGACSVDFDAGENIKFVPLDFVTPLALDQSASNQTISTSAKFARGDRVGAQLEGWDQEYEGIVDSITGSEKYKVLFDDGEVVEDVDESLLNIKKTYQSFESGDSIEAKIAGWDKYYKGKVVAAVGRSGYECIFDDGEHVPLIPSDLMRRGRPKLHPAGTRVLAKVAGWKTAYPGTVQSANLNGTYEILFDDGETQNAVSHEDVEKLSTEESATKNEKPSTNEEQSTSVRVAKEPIPESPNKFTVHQKIEAKIPEWSQYYSGSIMGINTDGTYCVSFEDGEMIPSLEEKYMRALEFSKSNDITFAGPSEWSPGMRVKVKTPEWDGYYPGTIKKANSDGTFHVDFDDGDVVEKAKPNQMKPFETSSTASTKKTDSGASQTWKAGMRVKVKTPEWDDYYPGTIKKANSDGTFHVDFDDGDVVEKAKPNQMKPFETSSTASTKKTDSGASQTWKAGMRVKVKTPEWDDYYPGTIKKANSDGTFHVDFDDGDVVEKAKPNQMKPFETPSTASTKKTDSGASQTWKAGMRVKVKTPEWDDYYPGTIKKANSDGTFHVDFDDGDVVEKAKPSQMKPFETPSTASTKKTDSGASQTWKAGMRVKVKTPEWDDYYPGTIKKANSDGTFHVDFDDGDVVEKAKPNQMKPFETPSTASTEKTDSGASQTWKAGMRVKVKTPEWDDYYPGTIKKANSDGTFHVDFDDGDVVEKAKPNQMKPFETPSTASTKKTDSGASQTWKAGMRVKVKTPEWDDYYPGTIKKANSDGTFHVDFDDGDVVEKAKPSQMKPFETSSTASTKKTDSGASQTWKAGMRVKVKTPEWDDYYPGTIKKANSDGTFHVDFDDGDVVEKAQIGQMQALVEMNWSEGMRVKAQIPEWEQPYAGTITAILSGGNFQVNFDDGEVLSNIKSSQMQVLEASSDPLTKLEGPNTCPKSEEIMLGDRVAAKLDAWNTEYKGVVTSVHPNGTFKIDFDDGEIQNAVQRKHITKQLPSNHSYSVNDQIIGHLPAWNQPFRGQVQAVVGRGSCKVKFEDGEVVEFFPCELMHPDPASTIEPQATNSKPPTENGVFQDTAEVSNTVSPTSYGENKPLQPKQNEITMQNKADVQPNVHTDVSPVKDQGLNLEKVGALDFREDVSNKGDESMAPMETPDSDVQRVLPQTAIMFNETAILQKKNVKAPDEASIQVFLCMFRGVTLRKSRQKDGSINADRSVKAFRKFSQGSEGRLSLSGFKKGLASLHIEDVSDEVLTEVLCRVSKHFPTVEFVTLLELSQFLLSQAPNADSLEGQLRSLVHRGADLAKAFRDFDMDGSGKVNASELCKVFAKACGKPMTMESAKAIIHQFDANGDGELDEGEFMRFAMPDFGVFVMTPIGQFFAPLDPAATFADARVQIGKRAVLVLDPRARELFGKRTVRLARHMGMLVLEPPQVKSAMLCAEVLRHGEQIWVLPDASSETFRYFVTNVKEDSKINGKENLSNSAKPAQLRRDSHRSKSRNPEERPRDSQLQNTLTTRKGSLIVDKNDQEISLATQRLEQVFEYLNIGQSGTIDKNAFIKAVKTKPQIRKLLSGSAALAQLRASPEKLLKKIDKPRILCNDVTKMLFPQKALEAKDDRDNTKTADTKNRWKKLQRQASAAKEFVKRYKDTGGQDLAAHFEETLGKEEVAKLSQEARARLWKRPEVAFDMRIDPNVQFNEDGERLLGQSPTDTQQWVNALSSDRWLGLQESNGNKRGKCKSNALSWCKAYTSTADLPLDPSTWSAYDVKRWVMVKLELPSLVDTFETMTGKNLLSIRDEDELPAGTDTLQRRKLISHIDQLREIYQLIQKKRNPRTISQDPERWCVADVIEWLANSLDAPREIQRAFRVRSVDGCLLLTLSQQDLLDEVGLDREWARKVFQATHSLTPPNQRQAIPKQSTDRPVWSPRSSHVEPDFMDELILHDIHEAIRHQQQEPRQVAQGSARKAVHTLRNEREFPELREEACSILNKCVSAIQPSNSRRSAVFNGSATGKECLKCIETALFAHGRRTAERQLETWYQTTDRLSCEELSRCLAQLFQNSTLMKGPINRLWEDVLGLGSDDFLFKDTARKVFLLGHSVEQIKLESRNPLQSYIRALHDAIGKLHVSDFKQRVQGSADAEVNSIVARVADCKRACINTPPGDVETQRLVARLEREFDRALLGEL